MAPTQTNKVNPNNYLPASPYCKKELSGDSPSPPLCKKGIRGDFPALACLSLVVLALAVFWRFFAGLSLAEDRFTCPQASLDSHPEQAVVSFLHLPAWSDGHYYALAVANGQNSPQVLPPVETGHAVPVREGWLYFIASHRELGNLATYRITSKDDDSKGATFVQAPLPEDGQALQPAHLDGVPEDAQVCALRL